MSYTVFPIGTRVADDANKTKKGTVIGASVKNPQIIAVEWDDGSFAQKNYDELYVMPVGLEADFTAIQTSLNEAADKIRDAVALAEKHNTSVIDLYYHEGLSKTELFNALDEAGWRTSSLDC